MLLKVMNEYCSIRFYFQGLNSIVTPNWEEHMDMAIHLDKVLGDAFFFCEVKSTAVYIQAKLTQGFILKK